MEKGGSEKRRISATGRFLLPSLKETSRLFPVYFLPTFEPGALSRGLDVGHPPTPSAWIAGQNSPKGRVNHEQCLIVCFTKHPLNPILVHMRILLFAFSIYDTEKAEPE